MPSQLPRSFSPARLAADGRILEGEVATGAMRRLASWPARAVGPATVRIEARADRHGRAVVSGTVQAEVEVVCQRCLEPWVLRLRSEIDLVAVRTEAEARALGGACEPLLLDADGRVGVGRLVEDELILALPRAPVHPAGTCEPPTPTPTAGVRAAPDHGAPASPFAVLARLREGSSGEGA